MPKRINARAAVLVAGCSVLLSVPTIAIATGEGQPVRGGERNPSPDGSQAYSVETEIIAQNQTYGTRQSNKTEGDGGGAIYGCRSNPGNEPCIRANNLRGGRAFEFVTQGKEGGRIEVADTTGAPLTTNANGVATGFNADKVDGKEAADFAPAGNFLFASVSSDATKTTGRGATGTALADPTFTYTVTFNRDVGNCSYTASPVGDESDQTLSVQPGLTPQTVRVDADARTAFHLQVIC